METDVITKESSVPGIGQAGLVMCPLLRGGCLRGGCELWVEMFYEDKKVARCSLAWLPVISTEVRKSIDGLTGLIKEISKDAQT